MKIPYELQLKLGWKINWVAHKFGYLFFCKYNHVPDAWGKLKCKYCKKFKVFKKL